MTADSVPIVLYAGIAREMSVDYLGLPRKVCGTSCQACLDAHDRCFVDTGKGAAVCLERVGKLLSTVFVAERMENGRRGQAACCPRSEASTCASLATQSATPVQAAYLKQCWLHCASGCSQLWHTMRFALAESRLYTIRPRDARTARQAPKPNGTKRIIRCYNCNSATE